MRTGEGRSGAADRGRGRVPGAGPLAGRRIVVTRARERAGDFAEALEAEGAEALVYPMIRIVGPEDPAPLRRAASEAGDYDWIVLTSANGVERFGDALAEAGRGADALAGVRIACVGPATAAAAEGRGWRVAVVPDEYRAEAVAEAMAGGAPLAGARILLPLAAGARPTLEAGLAERGARVERVEAYRSVPDGARGDELRRRIDRGEVDAIAFTSSSTVDNFTALVGADTGRAAVAAIGPVTAETARRHGIPVDVVAEDHTISGLVGALRRHFAAGPGRDVGAPSR